jgi:hypothetical protein
MSHPTDMGRVITDWLHADASSAGSERVLSASLARVAAAPQERRGIWRMARMQAHARLEMGRSGRVALAAGVAIVMIAIVINVVPSPPQRDLGATSASPRVSSAPAAPSEGPKQWTPPPVDEQPFYGPVPPGPYDISWVDGPADGRVRVTIPDGGWQWVGPDRSMIAATNGLRMYDFPADLAVAPISRIVTSVCPLDASTGEVGPVFEDVGPTVDDFMTATLAVDGIHWSTPEDVLIDGYPAKRIETTYEPDCDGPSSRNLSQSATSGLYVESGTLSTIYAVDVDGQRLVLFSNLRSASADIANQLDEIVASIDVLRGQAPLDRPIPTLYPEATRPFPQPVGGDAGLRVGRHRAVIDGIPFTFVVPKTGWETQLGFYLVRSITGPQDAEGTIRWTSVPNGQYTAPCPDVLDDSAGQSVGELIDAVSGAPGVRVLQGPMDASVGGRRAAHVVVQVARDLGCDPAYFYTYDAPYGGALWTATETGDVISIWIVEVGGKVLFIEAEATEKTAETFADRFQQIVDSMQFE